MRAMIAVSTVLSLGLLLSACNDEKAEKQAAAPTPKVEKAEPSAAKAPAVSTTEKANHEMTPQEALQNMKADAGRVVDKAQELAAKATESAQEAAAAVSNALTPGDAVSGEKVFNKCKACHTADAGGKNRVGPNLFGIVGREAGTVDGFKYSKALEAYKGIWSEGMIADYVADPTAFLKAQTGDASAKSKMTFKLKDEQARKDVAAYLGTMK